MMQSADHHPHRFSLDPTTHTVELAQVAELNAHLAAHPDAVTAADLGLAGVRPRFGLAPDGLPGTAVLMRLAAQGPPEYPYIYGHFSTPGAGELVVELHTASLRELARRLRLRQAWGVQSQ